MRVFVEDNGRIQIAVAGRSGAGEDIHLDSWTFSVVGRGEVGVVDSGAILGVSLEDVVSQAAAAEVVVLKVSGSFGETKLVKLVVHPIALIKKLHHRGILMRTWRLAQVLRKIKDAKGRPLGAREIGQIVRIQIQVRIDVVSARL